MAYRWSFMLEAVADVVRTAVLLLFYSIIFKRQVTLGSWSYAASVTLLGTVKLVNALSDLSFRQGSLALANAIRTGSLDADLLLPCNARIYCSLKAPKPSAVFSLVVAVALVIWGSTRLMSPPGLLLSLCYTIAVISGTATNYAVLWCVSCLAFWTVEIHAPLSFIRGIMDLAKFPVVVFDRIVRVGLYVLPVAFVGTVPTRLLSGHRVYMMTGVCVIIALFWMTLAGVVWRRGLATYSSAGGG
jgi:ABC-type uncharacterized transport system permease subunit